MCFKKYITFFALHPFHDELKILDNNGSLVEVYWFYISQT